MDSQRTDFDVIIIGGGAAGLMTSLLLSRQRRDLRIAILDGAARLGAKILISGGGRCNVTNRNVTARDFYGGSQNVIKRVLKHFSAQATVEFFQSLGVSLHEEDHGKLFPDTNKARSVLNALIQSAESLGVQMCLQQRVAGLVRAEETFRIETTDRQFATKVVVLATGGKSVPKTGSDGFGFELAQRLGHSLHPTLPALAPMLLAGEFHQQLSGISQEVELTLQVAQEKPQRFRGSLLWTHFGISGPVVLDYSRHWHFAQIHSKFATTFCNFCPNFDVQSFDAALLAWGQHNPTGSLRKQLSLHLPSRFVDATLNELNIPRETNFSQFPKANRQLLVRRLIARELSILDSRGFGFAEATAGGVPLHEINPSTMESRLCPSLYFTGEILDVDGRLGGFNFQWAWSSAAVAASGIANQLPIGKKCPE